MATSRYDTGAGAGPAGGGTTGGGRTTSGSSDSSTQGNSNTTGQSNTSGSSRTTQNANSSSTVQNMTGSSLAALELLIQQMLGGGTQEQAVSRAQRQQEIQRNQAQAAGYTRETAFSDAQGLMAQTMRQTLEKLLPSITRGSEGAGTSQGSMRALLTQKAAENAAEAASAQGLQAAVNYGQVNAGFGGILERLTQPDNSNTNALLQALQIARGAVTNTQSNSSQVSQTNSDQTTNSNSNTNTNQNTQQNTNQTDKPVSGGRIGASSPVDQLAYFGPQQTAPGNTAGSSIDFIRELNDIAGNQSGWSSGFSF